MKTKVTLFALCFSFSLLVAPARAQIGEGESSVNALAIQCAVSSGFSTDGFEDYSRRLAKTLALLSPAQQTRVFGFLPQPGGSMEADGGNLPVSPGQQMAAATSGETGSGTFDGLVALVGGINEALSGDSSTKTAPVYAAASINTPVANSTASASTAPVALTGSVADSDRLEGSPTGEAGQLLASVDAAATSGSQQKKFSWSEALAWLKEAESAYKDGNLKEFLKGEEE